MPKIPGVPTIDPVNKPLMSPAEAGRPGEAISQLGEVGNYIAQTGLDLDLYIKKGLERVDTLQSQNQQHALTLQFQDQLAKTQNSRDVPAIVEEYQKRLNDISAQWSKSPAAVEIQQNSDYLRPEIAHFGTVRQVDLMVKEGKIALDHQGDVFAQDYAKDRASGGNGDMALGAYTRAVDGLVKTGVLGNAEAEEKIRNFRIAGQSLQARLALESPNPQANIDMVNQLEQHPENFPDLTKEQVGDLVQKGTAAFETHTKQMEFATQQLVVNTIAPSLIKGATDEQGMFHLDQALTAASHLTPKEEEIVTPFLRGHAALADAEVMKALNKSQDDIEQAIAHNKFNEAMHIAGSQRNTAETSGSPWYANQVKRIDSARREADARYRANYNFDYARQKKEEDMASTRIARQMLPGIVSGQITQQQLTDSLGEGKLTYSRYLQLNHIMSTVASDPDTKKALSLMSDALPPPPKDAPPEDKMEYDNLAMNLVDAYQQGVAEKSLKGDDKTKYAMELVKPYVTKQVADRIDHLFDTPTAPKPTRSELFKQFVGGALDTTLGIHTPWEFGSEPDKQSPPQKSAPIIQHSPSTGEYRYSTDGGKTWEPGQPPQ